MNYLQIPYDHMEAAIIGDIHTLICDGLVETALKLHHTAHMELKNSIIVTISELFHNLLWSVLH